MSNESEITVQQVETFLLDVQHQFRKSSGSKYAAITLHLDGFSGKPEWGIHTGENLVTPNRGRDLYKVLAKEAEAIDPARRAIALREKAEELRLQADQIEAVSLLTGEASTVEGAIA